MTERIARITLDESSIRHRTMEVEHERSVAIADLLGDNLFEPAGMKSGPYDVHLRIEEGRLVFDITSTQNQAKSKVALSVQPLRSIIRDYFLICESYYQALKAASPSKLEAIDMGRRGMHNEGSEILTDMLEGKITVDHRTSRRLFTLICVLHIK
jgi:uncharacterized protein (UPF0262 family)